MDNRNGQFEPLKSDEFDKLINEPESGVFKVGEILEVRGSRLMINSISRNKLTLKVLPRING